MATQSAASAEVKWCTALFLWERNEGFLFWRGFPYRYQVRPAAEASVVLSSVEKKERKDAGIKCAETPQGKSGESIQNREAVKKES